MGSGHCDHGEIRMFSNITHLTTNKCWGYNSPEGSQGYILVGGNTLGMCNVGYLSSQVCFTICQVFLQKLCMRSVGTVSLFTDLLVFMDIFSIFSKKPSCVLRWPLSIALPYAYSIWCSVTIWII